MEERGGRGERPQQQQVMDELQHSPQVMDQQYPPSDDSSPSKRQRTNGAGENNAAAAAATNNNEEGDEYGFDINDAAFVESLDTISHHHLQVNLFGVFCTSENCVACPLLQDRGSNLWITSGKLIRAHWEKQKCYPGKVPNAEGTRKSLKAEQIRLHSQLKRSSASDAQRMVQQIFPPNCEVLSGDFYYCINCGAFSKRLNNIKRHFGIRNKELKCNSSLHLSRSKGKVSKGLHGFQCPSAIVEQIQSRQFTLPYEHPVSTVNQPLTTAHNNNNQLQSAARATAASATRPLDSKFELQAPHHFYQYFITSSPLYDFVFCNFQTHQICFHPNLS